jgi:hypothetical protein
MTAFGNYIVLQTGEHFSTLLRGEVGCTWLWTVQVGPFLLPGALLKKLQRFHVVLFLEKQFS